MVRQKPGNNRRSSTNDRNEIERRVQNLIDEYEFDDALELLNEAIRAHPMDAWAHTIALDVAIKADYFLIAVQQLNWHLELGADKLYALNRWVEFASYQDLDATLCLRMIQLTELFPDDNEDKAINLAQAHQVEQQLLKINEEAGLNNMSLAYLASAELIDAIGSLEDPQSAVDTGIVLVSREPDNDALLTVYAEARLNCCEINEALHTISPVFQRSPKFIKALLFVARYHTLTGNEEGAREVADIVLEQFKLSDPVACVVVLGYLGDYAAIEQYCERLDPQILAEWPVVTHALGVAKWHLGHRGKAIELWEQTIEIDPNFSIATENLLDAQSPASSRNGPWMLEPDTVLPATLFDELYELLDDFDDREESDPSGVLLERYSWLSKVSPWLLQHGDEESVRLGLGILMCLDVDAVKDQLLAFAASSHGSDAIRTTAYCHLQENNRLKPGPHPIWINDNLEHRSEFEIPTIPGEHHDRLIAAAKELFDAEDYPAAEAIAKEALQLDPESIDAAILLCQIELINGNSAACRKIALDLYSANPDNPMVAITVAHMHLALQETSKAEAVLKRIQAELVDLFNHQELGLFLEAEVLHSLQSNNPDVAEHWLSLYEELDPTSEFLISMRKEVRKLKTCSQISRPKMKPKRR